MATPRTKAAYRKQPSALAIDVSRLGRRPGSTFSINETVASPSRIGLNLVGIAKGADLDLDLRLEAVSEGVLVTGTLWAPTSGECARCLTPITGEVEIFLTELFAYPNSATEATTDEEDVARVIDDIVDIEQAIVDAVGLELPLSPVCQPDCQGLCPDCGEALAGVGPDHHHDKIDPRWAKLAAMLPDETDEASRGGV